MAPRLEERIGAAVAWLRSELAAPTADSGCGRRPPDLVLLQEIWRPRDAERLTGALAGAFDFLGTPGSFFPGRKAGLLALVRRASGWRVREEAFFEFTAEAPAWRFWEGDGLGDKGAQRLLLAQEDGRRLGVVNTHLQAQYEGRAYAEVRAAQLAELDRFGRELPADVPVLLAGDLNTRPDDPVLAPLLRGWNDLTAPLRERCGCGTTAGAPSEWIDYVMARRTARWRAEALRAERIESPRPDDPFSDHHGLDLTLALERAVAGWGQAPGGGNASSLLPAVDAAALACLAGPSSRRAWIAAVGHLALRAAAGLAGVGIGRGRPQRSPPVPAAGRHTPRRRGGAW